MGTRGFSLTRVILVAVLLGALFTISKVVNPPPALPGEAKQTDDHDDSHPAEGKGMMNTEAIKKQQKDDYTKKAKMMRDMTEKNKNKKPTLKSSGMDITPKFFDENPMGAAGVKEMDAKWKEADEEESKQKKQVPKLAPSMPPPTEDKSGASSSSPPAAASGK